MNQMNQVTINLDAKVINPKFRVLLTDKSRTKVIWGGAGSSKSFSITQVLLFKVLSEHNVKVLVTRKVARTLRYSVFALFKHIISKWKLQQYFTINKTDLTITCTINGNEILFLGLDDVEKLKSISNVTDVWMEEASEDTQDDYQQLDVRLRGITKVAKQIILSFNPISIDHWLKSYFFDTPKADTLLLHSTYKDNQYLDDEYKQRLESYKSVDPYYYNVYCLGEWGNISSAKVFSKYVIEDFDTEHLESVC